MNRKITRNDRIKKRKSKDKVYKKAGDLQRNLKKTFEAEKKLKEDNIPILYKKPNKNKAKGKFVVHDEGGSKKKQALQIEMLSAQMQDFGLTEEDSIDTLDLMAQHIINMLNMEIYTVDHLTKIQKQILYRYFSRKNPVLGRILDLHTDLPLSKLRIQIPNDIPEIAKDYIMQYFEKVLERLDFANIIRNMVMTYNVYGEAFVLVDDYYKENKKELQDLKTIQENVYEHNEDDREFLEEVEIRYSKDPKSVNVKDRLKYIETRFKGFYEKSYSGPDKLRVLRFYEIFEYFENLDIDYEAIKYRISESLKDLINDKETEESLLELGYTKGYLQIVQENEDMDSVIIDNDIYAGYPFIFSFKRPESSSLVNRVLNECLEWENVKKSLKARIRTLGKIGRIVTSENLSIDQTQALKAEVTLMLEDPNHAIVANFPVHWEEVNTFVKEELNNIIDSTDKIKEDIAMGLGMPDSLLTGESQYTGDNIKLEMLNTQYLAFKNMIQNVIEEKLFKPIALRKGFVTVDDWGNPQLIYPRLSFSRIAIRDSDTYNILMDLYLKGSLPVSIIYDVLNIDTSDIERAIKNDLFSIKDPNFNEIIRDILTQAADEIFAKTNVTDKLIETMGLKIKQQSEEESEEFIEE